MTPELAAIDARNRARFGRPTADEERANRIALASDFDGLPRTPHELYVPAFRANRDLNALADLVDPGGADGVPPRADESDVWGVPTDEQRLGALIRRRFPAARLFGRDAEARAVCRRYARRLLDSPLSLRENAGEGSPFCARLLRLELLAEVVGRAVADANREAERDSVRALMEGRADRDVDDQGLMLGAIYATSRENRAGLALARRRAERARSNEQPLTNAEHQKLHRFRRAAQKAYEQTRRGA